MKQQVFHCSAFICSLPGKEALYEPGRSDGQTKLVREGTQVTVYSWSSDKKEWSKVGDVAGANEQHSGKTLHEGKVSAKHFFTIPPNIVNFVF